MDSKLAKEKSLQLSISEIQVVREEYEMVLLSALFESPFGKKLVFRGGTALRLAYNSPRFSEDLDFSQIEPIPEKEFQTWCQTIANNNSGLELKEALQKRFTLFALFKIKDPTIAVTISIKIEISVRKVTPEQKKSYQLMKLQSEVTPITAIAQVASVKWIQKEKLSISPKRVRDIFDLWFIGQLLKKTYPMDFKGFTNNKVKGELNKLLGLGAKRLVLSWLSKN
ncbi:MAG: hypothetical protein A2365_00345 [Candidatus Nealsonbacteria bacterium RIFOXYB1_FULL_40_15]|uniref:Nucleotidyl transferase AbiEii/AbiGii toxin family protein n=1 Tax=Candidatus Nealsonbacteria bacterium RIFOXYB1_FULL_40_15 TaxID=1801677 RepID=A0A1G2EM35_9BACT|nr:MAG: hypothetical protein A2365_00345 [Candidatus Nealsonbacteria bacterium RIFOXYB1_FULL_40_15]